MLAFLIQMETQWTMSPEVPGLALSVDCRSEHGSHSSPLAQHSPRQHSPLHTRPSWLNNPTTSESLAPTKKHGKENKLDTCLSSLQRVVELVASRRSQEATASASSASNTNDADAVFGAMVASELRLVPNGPSKARAKHEISRILFSLQSGDFSEPTPPSHIVGESLRNVYMPM